MSHEHKIKGKNEDRGADDQENRSRVFLSMRDSSSRRIAAIAIGPDAHLGDRRDQHQNESEEGDRRSVAQLEEFEGGAVKVEHEGKRGVPGAPVRKKIRFGKQVEGANGCRNEHEADDWTQKGKGDPPESADPSRPIDLCRVVDLGLDAFAGRTGR